jgi:hypothetical protein
MKFFDLLLILGFMCYLFYLVGIVDNIEKRTNRRLLHDPRFFWMHLLISVACAGLGALMTISLGLTAGAISFIPLFFILLLKLINYFSTRYREKEFILL